MILIHVNVTYSHVGIDVEKDVQVHKRKIQAVGQVRHLFYA
jgi:hypothetical protein